MRLALLVVPLALACLAGFMTTYVLILLVVLAAAWLWLARTGVRFDAVARGFASAFVVLALLFALTARSPADVLLAFNFVAFLAYAPMATLFRRAGDPGNALIVARLSLLGAALGCALALADVFVLHNARAGETLPMTDTIRLGGTALLLGFLALVGLVAARGRERLVYLAGPVLALAVLLLTGARGAMLAFPVLLLAATLILARRKALAIAGASGVVLVLVAAAAGGVFGSRRLDSIFRIVGNLLAGHPVGDEATRIRLELYWAGWRAFEQSPLIGHGWARLMSSVEPFLPAGDRTQARLPHLHNDLLSFAVSGGLVGVLTYLALMAMPVILVLRSPRDSQYRARLLGIGVIVAGYVAMGLPDTMLGFELHTALYVALTAIVLSYCRDHGVTVPK